MDTSERFLIAMLLIFSVPYLIWRLARTEYFAPLVVVQIIAGILLGPGVLGAALPAYYDFVFTPAVITALNGVAGWAVMIFVWIAGIELDLSQVWRQRRESGINAGLALGLPLTFGALAAAAMLATPGWIGPAARDWQFVLGVGMSCAVTALPILILFMEKLDLLRRPIGQRILRYASLDDIALGRAGADPAGLAARRPPGAVPGAVRRRGLGLAPPHGRGARARPLVPGPGLAGGLRPAGWGRTGPVCTSWSAPSSPAR